MIWQYRFCQFPVLSFTIFIIPIIFIMGNKIIKANIFQFTRPSWIKVIDKARSIYVFGIWIFLLPMPLIQNDFLTFFSFCEAYWHQSIALWQIFRASDHPRVCHSPHTNLPLLISCFSYRIERDVCIHCHYCLFHSIYPVHYFSLLL